VTSHPVATLFKILCAAYGGYLVFSGLRPRPNWRVTLNGLLLLVFGIGSLAHWL
jgi:hypothetical protein